MEEGLRDIHGFYALELPQWILWGLYAIIAAFVFYFIYNRFLKKTQNDSFTLFELTCQHLTELDLNQNSKSFYLSYSELVKSFFQHRLGLDLIDKTADELKPVLISSPMLATESALTLSKIFKKADLAKFARQELAADIKAQDIETTVRIITELEEAVNAEEQRQKQAKLEEAKLT